jgi:hypothetical protein
MFRRLSAGEFSGELTSQVSTKHKIEYEETVFIILKSVAQIYNERMINLEPKSQKIVIRSL